MRKIFAVCVYFFGSIFAAILIAGSTFALTGTGFQVSSRWFVGDRGKFEIAPIDPRKSPIDLLVQPSPFHLFPSFSGIRVAVTLSLPNADAVANWIVRPLVDAGGKVRDYKILDEPCNIYIENNSDMRIFAVDDGRKLESRVHLDLDVNGICANIGSGRRSFNISIPATIDDKSITIMPRMIDKPGFSGYFEKKINKELAKNDKIVYIPSEYSEIGIRILEYKYSGSSDNFDLMVDMDFFIPWKAILFIRRVRG